MIAIIDYRAGNLKSVERALRHLGVPCRVTQDHREIPQAERIVFPGVGAAGKAMEDLQKLGLDIRLREAFQRGTPILGICLGAQIVLERSEEDGAACLGLIRGQVKRFSTPLFSESGQRLKVPHMGWNRVRCVRSHPVTKTVGSLDEFYFVHSYYTQPEAKEAVLGTTDHGMVFPSVIGAGSLIAVQFHPEKSGAAGLRLLREFCRWDGSDAK